jgi:O-antigen/teichoic acid export membrane protein
MGTGVNSQIIGTSTYWRFEMTSGIVLLLVMLPLNYFLTKRFDIVGTALANLVSISIYNIIRILFLWKKFNLFPFTAKSFYTIVLTGGCFIVCFFLFRNIHGLEGLFLRSVVFCTLFGAGTFYMKLSPDVVPVLNSIKRRIGIRD